MNNALKELVRQRARNCCEYCLSQAQFSPSPFSVEHIDPLAKGGSSKDSNLAFSCQGCNNIKFTATTARDPLTNNFVPLYHPRQDVWSDHFKWDKHFAHIEGVSPTGRATVERLQLNRPNLLNLRKALVAFGKHPPRF
jgi:5-methylcytosine-specific restriction endonuclease McrA